MKATFVEKRPLCDDVVGIGEINELRSKMNSFLASRLLRLFCGLFRNPSRPPPRPAARKAVDDAVKFARRSHGTHPDLNDMNKILRSIVHLLVCFLSMMQQPNEHHHRKAFSSLPPFDVDGRCDFLSRERASHECQLHPPSHATPPMQPARAPCRLAQHILKRRGNKSEPRACLHPAGPGWCKGAPSCCREGEALKGSAAQPDPSIK